MAASLEDLKQLRIMSGEKDEDTLELYFDIAGEAILRRAYPFDRTGRSVPSKYRYKQLEIACFLLNKRGAEGQTAHSENGINRTYENADIPESMLAGITPFVAVI